MREAGGSAGEVNVGIHPAAQQVLQFFAYAHLPERLQDISKPLCDLAYHMATTLPQNQELTVGLRKMLEAKDAFVRAALSGSAGG